jgi:hypothetical protein
MNKKTTDKIVRSYLYFGMAANKMKRPVDGNGSRIVTLRNEEALIKVS